MLGILKWFLLSFGIYVVSGLPAEAQPKYNIVFYNVENLFDTKTDPETADGEFTSFSERHWTYQRFEKKIRMIYKALITAGNGQFPDIIGLAEVENLWVIEQLVNKTPLNRVQYGIIHKDSPDPRGVPGVGQGPAGHSRHPSAAGRHAHPGRAVRVAGRRSPRNVPARVRGERPVVVALVFRRGVGPVRTHRTGWRRALAG